MHRSVFKLACIIVFSAIDFTVYAQNSISNDTLSYAFARSLFAKANSPQSRLNNGREYIPNNPRIKGHPFFETNVWTIGDLVYDGAEFKNVKMLYDLEKDEVVVLNFLLPNKLSLIRSKVDSFIIHTHQFIYLKTDNPNKKNSGGFYDLLYDKGLAVLAKRKKEIIRDANFIQADEYFIMINETLHPVKSLSSILKLLKIKKADVQLYLKNNDIVFRNDPEKAIISIASYYDLLNN